MYAIVTISGSQMRVQEGAVVRVPRLSAEPGTRIQLSNVLLISKDDEASLGCPTVEGASVEALVTSHGLGDKVIVFKMKKRKNYRRKRGHRQPYTELEIQKILMPGEIA